MAFASSHKTYIWPRSFRYKRPMYSRIIIRYTDLEHVRQPLDPLRPLLDEVDVLEDLAAGSLGHTFLLQLLLSDLKQLLVGQLQEDLGVLVQAEGLEPVFDLCKVKKSESFTRDFTKAVHILG